MDIQTKITIINQKITFYNNSLFSYQIDYQIGQQIKDNDMIFQATEGMKKCENILSVLKEIGEKLLKEISYVQ